jgi:hypothetical protein
MNDGKFSVSFNSQVVNKPAVFGTFTEQFDKVISALQLKVVVAALNYAAYPVGYFVVLHALSVF